MEGGTMSNTIQKYMENLWKHTKNFPDEVVKQSGVLSLYVSVFINVYVRL